jgi:hypothetical protein
MHLENVIHDKKAIENLHMLGLALWSVGPAAELPGKAATNTGRERPAGLYWHT